MGVGLDKYPRRKNFLEKKRKCAGYPGYDCDKLITDYRCPSCWKAIRLKSYMEGNLSGLSDDEGSLDTINVLN